MYMFSIVRRNLALATQPKVQRRVRFNRHFCILLLAKPKPFRLIKIPAVLIRAILTSLTLD